MITLNVIVGLLELALGCWCFHVSFDSRRNFWACATFGFVAGLILRASYMVMFHGIYWMFE